MNKIYNDKEYINYVEDILDNKEFNELKKYLHHGGNRYDHCLRVSYHSYKLAKKFKLKEKEVARAGLLHDFFMVNNQEIGLKRRIKVLFTHPKIALSNAQKYYKLNDMEKNIIVSHMFPIGLTLPKYKESWLIDTVDNAMSIYERIYNFSQGIKSKFKKPVKANYKIMKKQKTTN